VAWIRIGMILVGLIRVQIQVGKNDPKNKLIKKFIVFIFNAGCSLLRAGSSSVACTPSMEG